MALWGGVGSVDTQVVQLCGPIGLLGWNPGVGLLCGVLGKGHLCYEATDDWLGINDVIDIL